MNHTTTTSDHDGPKENTRPLVKLAVYGTLRQGHANHDRFCRGVLSIQPITIIGRLYQFPSGIPILEVPEEHILAHGTADPWADVATQERFTRQLAEHPDLLPKDPPECDWGRLSGELLTFDDPEVRLPAIDRLEGFRPGCDGAYKRVLASVLDSERSVPSLAWLYILDDNGITKHQTHRILSWP